MYDNVKIADLLALLEPIGLQSPELQDLSTCINGCIETLYSENHAAWNTKSNATNIVLKVTSDCFPGLGDALQDDAKKTSVKTIMKGIKEIVNKAMKEYKPKPIEPTVQPPSVPKAPSTPAPRQSMSLLETIRLNVTPRATAMAESDNEDSDDSGKWLEDRPQKTVPLKTRASTQSTPVEHERPKSKTPPKKHNQRRHADPYIPMQRVVMPTAIDKKGMEKLARIREDEARREAFEAQQALERKALLDASPQTTVITPAKKSEKKQALHSPHADNNPPAKRKAQPKVPRRPGPFAEIIDFAQMREERTLRSNTAQSTAATIPAPNTVRRPSFSTSPPLADTNNPPSPVQVSPRTPKRLPAATTTPNQSPKKPSPRLRTTSPKRTRTSLVSVSDSVDLNETCSSISSAPRTPSRTLKSTAQDLATSPTNALLGSPDLSALATATSAQTRMSLHQTPPAAQSPHTPVASRSPMAAPLSRTPRDIRSTSQIHIADLSVTSAIPNDSVTPMLLHAYTPEHRSTRSGISSPAPQTPRTPATPKNAVSPAVVVIPPDEIMTPMGAPLFAQGENVIEQPRQSPLSSPMATRYPIFLDTESPILIRSRTRRQSSQPHTPVAVSFDVQTIVPMEQQQHALPLTTVIPNAEGLQSPLPARSEQASPGVLQFSPVHSRQSPRVSPRPRVHTPPHHSPVALAAPSPRRVSGVKRKSPIDSYQAKRNKYK